MLDSQPVKKNILTTYNTANILFRESGWSEFGITRVTGGQELHNDEQFSFFLALSTDLAKPPAHCRPVSPACFLAAQPLLPSLFPRIELLGQAGHRGGGRSPLIGFSATDSFIKLCFLPCGYSPC